MSRWNFVGDLELIRERQLEFIGEVLEKKGFKGPEARIENVGVAGDNYIANVKRVVVTEDGKTFKMIAKLAPENQMMRFMAQIETLFRNEHTIYTDLLPKFVQLQRSAGVPEEELYRFAECYGSLAEVPSEVILLEDLKESQYDILDRFKPLSTDNVKLVLKNFAIFHSLSYVLKHQEPETFAEIASKFGDMHSVIQQGDGWTNNIMFRCKADAQVDCVLIDYQMVRESNPVFDIMYMMFNSTSHEQRLKHYNDFIDHYHTELDRSLHNYGLKASSIYPRDKLDCDLKRYGKLMFATSIMITNIVLKKVEDAEVMKEAMKTSTTDNMEEMMAQVLKQHPETVILFKSKIEGLIDSFVEFGLL
ncbi:Uncharacterized protein OBRU01_04786 [Operophtera brumata]|uniref:CHK kinase-like domain-containing protein n=1 Tax=Operophtera brumata TaxID=104452 RepID=A0A0L7LNR9_OPEBR|nr:Uncharacterized protein OBRU01_04786 [Operophtera brumata]